ncbi:MAG: ATP-grasp domain-containing protein [Clostridia bacterium]|nr:ATP-grasp domain-containing protein [Clostridia bacterium]
MIKKILIANRGEIAIRIIRTCKEMGIKTVSIYSNEDKDALHVFMADESVCTEKENDSDGYTNIDNIIQAAINTKCDAIHCGYGFLSECYEFAKRIEQSGLIYIGTNPDVLKGIENKYLLKEKVQKLGIPIIESYEAENIKKEDFPILIKSAIGAGGKGIEKIENIEEFKFKFGKISNDLKNKKIYIEKYIKGYRHIEIQYAADKFGNIITFPERDCSLQINYKKVIEMTPSSNISKNLIAKMKKDTLKIVKELGYTNIGTAEFIVDKDNNYYFIEINPRIQVEHTVTEMCADVDLVKMQIEIADRKNIEEYKNIKSSNIFAIEARINALEGNKNITFCNFPLGNNIRLDTHIYNGMKVSINYDPMLMKIICKGKTKEGAINRLKQALEELIIEGIDTNINYLYDVITSEKFVNGEYDLEYLKEV